MPTKAVEIGVRPLALILVLILLAAVFAWSVWSQSSLMDRINSIEAALQNQSNRFDDFVAVEKAIIEQRDILNTALGHVLPVKMSSRWENRLQRLENQLSKQEMWPQNANQSALFLRELSALVSELSPLAEANYFPRLAPVRWAAIAFEAMHQAPKPGEGPSYLADQLHAIVGAKPAGIYSDIGNRLLKRAKEHEKLAEKRLIDELIHQAEQYLDIHESSWHDSSRPDRRIGEVYDSLGLYKDHGERKDKINALRSNLEEQMPIREMRAQATALKNRWTKTNELVANNAPAYETATNMLLREVTIARSTAALQGISTSDYDALVVEIQKVVEGIEGSVRRKYQEWALRKLIEFENALGDIEEKGDRKEEEIQSDVSSDQRSRDKPKEEAKVTSEEGLREKFKGFLNKGERQIEKIAKSASDILTNDLTADQYQKIQDAMISYLLPIDRALLEFPVLKRYQREFNNGWKHLNGRDEQTCVAIAASLVKKRTLRDFQHNQPEAVLVEGGGLWIDTKCG